jgi:hypothetical protein
MTKLIRKRNFEGDFVAEEVCKRATRNVSLLTTNSKGDRRSPEEFGDIQSPFEYSHDNHDLYIQNLPRDIGWHIHPYDGSSNITYDICGWHFTPPNSSGLCSNKATYEVSSEEATRDVSPLPSSHALSNTVDASLNWYYYHHGHVVDSSLTDTSGITTNSSGSAKQPGISFADSEDAGSSDFIPDVTIPNSSGGEATF